MKAVTPVLPAGVEAKGVTFAKDQPEYNPLPALVEADGTVHTRWQLTDEERAAVAAGADIKLELLTFGRPLQPLRIAVAGVQEGDGG